jgi:hypothetical protein
MDPIRNGSYAAVAARKAFASVQEAHLAHKYRVGDNVHIIAGLLGRGDATGVFQVVRVLPIEGDEQQYRIKSANEPHERVAKHSQLERAA